MGCPWNNEGGRVFGNHCPILLHSLYPYFLGFVFGAKFSPEGKGDGWVGCPAEHGVDTIVKVRPVDHTYREWVPKDWRDVIHAEVVKVNGKCDFHYQVGDKIIFPTCAKEQFKCPAGVNNAFLFMKIPIPPCINLHRLRCPDWKENVTYDLEDLK